ncbi:hypothetical protein BDR26DRAFT_856944 [Obelidium mucronatum]|nr:hypothetical protein BDR26DRAFT_856944 [Obelidium mucronatum]
MLVCILTLTVCCVSLILENWGSNNLLFDVDLGFVHLSMSIVFFAILMLIVCHALNSITLCIMLDFAKGRVTRHVVGISADRIAAFSANNSLESCASRSEVIVRVDAV